MYEKVHPHLTMISVTSHSNFSCHQYYLTLNKNQDDEEGWFSFPLSIQSCKLRIKIKAFVERDPILSEDKF